MSIEENVHREWNDHTKYIGLENLHKEWNARTKYIWSENVHMYLIFSHLLYNIYINIRYMYLCM